MAAKPFVLCLTGAECTGKTTLAAALASHYGATLVPEAARCHLAPNRPYGPDDVLAIARTQLRWEAQALEGPAQMVVCDTDLLVIQIWWQVKFGPLPEELKSALAGRSARAYLLTRPDIPWVPDHLRESGGERWGLHRRYRQALAGGPHPYLEVGGERYDRLANARQQVDRWLSARARAGAVSR